MYNLNMERIDDLNLNGKKIIQNTDYFLFGMDSVLLANKVKVNEKQVVLDLGTGTSVIPVILSQKTNSKTIIGIELQKEMYDLAIKNVKYNDLEDKIKIFNLDLKDIGSIRKKIIEISGKDTVDIIVSNPPYKEKGTGSENEKNIKYIARHEVKCSLEDVFLTSSKLLKSKGKLYLVHKPERLSDLITIGRKYNLELKNLTMLQPTKTKRPSLILLEYVFGGGNECKIDPVIFEYDENFNYTKEIYDIYSEKKED